MTGRVGGVFRRCSAWARAARARTWAWSGARERAFLRVGDSICVSSANLARQRETSRCGDGSRAQRYPTSLPPPLKSRPSPPLPFPQRGLVRRRNLSGRALAPPHDRPGPSCRSGARSRRRLLRLFAMYGVEPTFGCTRRAQRGAACPGIFSGRALAPPHDRPGPSCGSRARSRRRLLRLFAMYGVEPTFGCTRRAQRGAACPGIFSGRALAPPHDRPGPVCWSRARSRPRLTRSFLDFRDFYGVDPSSARAERDRVGPWTVKIEQATPSHLPTATADPPAPVESRLWPSCGVPTQLSVGADPPRAEVQRRRAHGFLATRAITVF